MIVAEQSKMKCKIGCDPEFFVKRKSDGKLVCAYGLIPGDKKKPFKVSHGAIQVDGMAVEINIDPASDAIEFERNIKAVIKQLEEILGPKYELVYEASVEFDKDIWDAAPKESKELGCDPDYNAYTGNRNAIKLTTALERVRTAAGHIHIGWTEDEDVKDPSHIEACKILCRELDLHIAAPLALCITSPNESRRRSLYGGAGAFRPKPYGAEYRAPSNFWLTDSDAIRYVFNRTQEVFSALLEGSYLNQSQTELVRTAFHTGFSVATADSRQYKGLVKLVPSSKSYVSKLPLLDKVLKEKEIEAQIAYEKYMNSEKAKKSWSFMNDEQNKKAAALFATAIKRSI